MARYFFHFTNGRTLREDEGEDLPDLLQQRPMLPELPPNLRQNLGRKWLQY
jgi:hypothetical protein